MEPSNQITITVKGPLGEYAPLIGEAVGEVIHALAEADPSLDFRRMRRVIVTTDFAGELKELSAQTASGQLITHTEEEYAVAVAKVVLLPHEEGIEIVPVFNAMVASGLLWNEEESDAVNENRRRAVTHYLHHEFCHVHDDNKKIDALPGVILRQAYSGKDTLIMPLAEVCWSEYIANYMASFTATDEAVEAMAGSLADAITRTKPAIDAEILSYRHHADLEKLLGVFERHGCFLPKVAAYTLGYIDGLEKSLEDISADAAARLSGSYFEPTWRAMHDALRGMRQLYPEGWEDMGVYAGLARALENYHASMGLILSTTREGGAYVHIPFRPETTPRY
jgi:hypothetical protein